MGKELNILLEEIKQLMDYNRSLGGLILEQGSADIVDMRRSEEQLKNSNAPEKRKKENDIKYFNFGNIAKIPYTNGTQLFYLNNIDTGNILGLTKKDKYGYYDEIFVDSYNANVRRYYPTSDWEDWSYLKRNKIPYSFKTKNGQFFHLLLKLIDPTKSVSDLDDSSNKSRGWALSYPGSKNAVSNDSGTGYYRTDGGNQIPYNITAPIVPGDLSTYDLDSRSGFDKFMDSGFGVIAQVVVAIGVTLLTRNLAIGQMTAEGIVSTNVIRSRLFLASVFAESLQGIPLSIYYFNRPGYESAGWMSLAFIMLPAIQRFTPLNNILPDFNTQTCLGISKKIMESNLKTITQSDLKAFMSKLSMEEKTLFLEVLKKSDDISKIMKSSEGKFLKQELKSPDYLKYKDELLALVNKPTESLFKTMTKDFGITFTYAKLVETIVESYMNYKEKRGVDAKSMSKDFKKKIAKNVKKIDEKINLMPEWAKYYIKDIDVKVLPFILNEKMMLELCENGIFSDELSMKLLGYVGDKTIALVKEANKKTESLLKSIGMDRFNELVTFIFDPEFKKSLSPDKIKELENLIEENKKFEEPKPVEDEVTNTQTSDGWTITKNKTEYIKFKKDTNYDTKIEGTSPDFTFYYKLKQQ
jgi:hypothetical protein